jgi:hypothetical protein
MTKTRLVETLQPKDAKRMERDGRNARGVCCVAYKIAMRDGKDIKVGPTYYGYTIGRFPETHPHFTVKPNGEVWLTEPDIMEVSR